MTRKQTRLDNYPCEPGVLGAARGLILYAIRDTIVFFYTPSEMAEKNVAARHAHPLGWHGGKGQLEKN